MKRTVDVYKVFVGTHDTYEPEDYQFIGSYDECVDYVNTYGYQACSYIEPAGYTREELHVGLCKGRHEIPQVGDDYVFDEIVDPMDFMSLRKGAAQWLLQVDIGAKIYLYVTGFTPALVAVINAVNISKANNLVLMHFDRDSNSYKGQPFIFIGGVNHD